MSALAALPELTVCDREPITRLEAIQGFAFLLALSSDWTVVRASANLGDLIGVAAADAIGASIADLIDDLALHDIRNRVVVLNATRGSERLYGVRLTADDTLFDVALHRSGDLLVIEGEPSGQNGGADAASLVRTMVARLNTMETMDGFHRDCARQVRALTSFGRVMIYRFDANGDGEVIAESINGEADSFLGLHYPASDIPSQARALYLRNPFRIIGDVHREPVPLLPAASASVPVLDLSLAVSRAVSPVHVEYLRNMGVAASLSLSIVVDGRLWGLIACHHDQPCVPSFVSRTASELFAQMYSMVLESRLRQAATVDEAGGRRHADRMIGAIAAQKALLTDAAWLHGAFAPSIACDGIAVSVKGRVSTSGAVPSGAAIDALLHELGAIPAGHVFSTDRIGSLLSSAGDDFFAPAAGLLAIPVSPGARDHVLLFRCEQERDVSWGGDPDKALVADDTTGRISPRKSFEAFNTRTRGRSRPFPETERRTAEIIGTSLVEIVFRGLDAAGDDAQRVTANHEVLIAELNHRVRNILALIRGLINQSATGNSDVAGYVQSLNGRVQALARAHDQVTRHHWGPGLLSSLFEHEIKAHVPTELDRFQVLGAPVHLVPQAFSTLALVIHELVTNSTKYGALSGSGRIEVDVERLVGDGLWVRWREMDGPPVMPPTRRGFGSAIIERTVPFDLEGMAEVRYQTTGLEVDLFIPEQFVWTGSVALAAVPEPDPVTIDPAERPLSGMAVLLLEDSMLVALEAEDLLRALGAATVHVASTLDAGANVIARQSIDLAVLDVHIGGRTSKVLAEKCVEQGIPYFFASGYEDDARAGGPQRRFAMVRKPYLLDDVRRVVTETLGRHTVTVDLQAQIGCPGWNRPPEEAENESPAPARFIRDF